MLGIGEVPCYIDIFLGATFIEKCIEPSELVLKRLNEYNVRIDINPVKHLFDLGHIITQNGIHPNPERKS